MLKQEQWVKGMTVFCEDLGVLGPYEGGDAGEYGDCCRPASYSDLGRTPRGPRDGKAPERAVLLSTSFVTLPGTVYVYRNGEFGVLFYRESGKGHVGKLHELASLAPLTEPQQEGGQEGEAPREGVEYVSKIGAFKGMKFVRYGREAREDGTWTFCPVDDGPFCDFRPHEVEEAAHEPAPHGCGTDHEHNRNHKGVCVPRRRKPAPPVVETPEQRECERIGTDRDTGDPCGMDWHHDTAVLKRKSDIDPCRPCAARIDIWERERIPDDRCEHGWLLNWSDAGSNCPQCQGRR